MRLKFDYVDNGVKVKSIEECTFMPRFSLRLVEFEGSWKEWKQIVDFGVLVPFTSQREGFLKETFKGGQ